MEKQCVVVTSITKASGWVVNWSTNWRRVSRLAVANHNISLFVNLALSLSLGPN